MKSELTFLMDLFLTEALPLEIKRQVAERIREVEEALRRPMEFAPVRVYPQAPPNVAVQPSDGVIGAQSPSMQRLMQKHPDVPVVTAAVTPAAALALQQRAELLRKGMSEKPEQGMTSKRKI